MGRYAWPQTIEMHHARSPIVRFPGLSIGADLFADGSQAQLVERLFRVLRPRSDSSSHRLVVFAGSGLTKSVVPGVGEMIDMVDELVDQWDLGIDVKADFRAIAMDRTSSAAAKYGAYQQLLDRSFGAGTFDKFVVAHAVSRAYRPSLDSELRQKLAGDPWMSLDNFAPKMEQDLESWSLPRGVEALASIYKESEEFASPIILTTNFDPLIEIALRREGIQANTLSLPVDGSLASVVGGENSVAVVHLHGFWRKSASLPSYDNLHSDALLRSPRERLSAELQEALAKSIVLVVGYGAWTDVFSDSITKNGSNGFKEMLWSSFEGTGPELERVKSLLADANGKPLPRAMIYTGVDCDQLFPAVFGRLRNDDLTRKLPKNLDGGLIQLDSIEALDPSLGKKVSNLAKLVQAGINVPQGVVVKLAPVGDLVHKAALAESVWREIHKSADLRLPLIVRSSASVEDQPKALFPGVFSTTRDVTSLVKLTGAIASCDDSRTSEAVSAYIGAVGSGISPDEIQMAVLVQNQVAGKFAGVAFTNPPAPTSAYVLVVQVTTEASFEMLRGVAVGATYGFHKDDPATPVHLGGPEYPLADVARALDSVRSAVIEVGTVLAGESLDVEWVWDGKSVHIVQARELEAAAPLPEDVRTATLDPERPSKAKRSLPLQNIDEWGHKGAASFYFQTSGIGGAKNATFILPRATIDDVKSTLQDRTPSSDGVTVRFSHKTRLALPRKFIESTEDISETYFQLRADPEWFGIISDFVFVHHSFEAYVGRQDLLVEHVPGNWETESSLEPDVFIWGRGTARFLRVRDRRQAKFSMPGDIDTGLAVVRSVEPMEVDLAKRLTSQFLPKLETIRSDLAEHLPLNIHFVHDGKEGLYFLNIRPTDELDLANFGTNPKGLFRKSRLYAVATLDQLEAWDGETHLLLSATRDRQLFAEFVRLAEQLRLRGVRRVFCTFGVLSHPAILLRELGIEVVPLLLTHEDVNIDLPRW